MNDLENLYLSRPIDELLVSVRVANCLQWLDIQTVGELVQKTAGELLRGPNFGRRSLREVELLLEAMGLRLRSDEHDVDKPKQPGVENC